MQATASSVSGLSVRVWDSGQVVTHCNTWIRIRFRDLVSITLPHFQDFCFWGFNIYIDLLLGGAAVRHRVAVRAIVLASVRIWVTQVQSEPVKSKADSTLALPNPCRIRTPKPKPFMENPNPNPKLDQSTQPSQAPPETLPLILTPHLLVIPDPAPVPGLSPTRNRNHS